MSNTVLLLMKVAPLHAGVVTRHIVLPVCHLFTRRLTICLHMPFVIFVYVVNIMHNMLYYCYSITALSASLPLVIWLPLHHDMTYTIDINIAIITYYATLLRHMPNILLVGFVGYYWLIIATFMAIRHVIKVYDGFMVLPDTAAYFTLEPSLFSIWRTLYYYRHHYCRHNTWPSSLPSSLRRHLLVTISRRRRREITLAAKYYRLTTLLLFVYYYYLPLISWHTFAASYCLLPTPQHTGSIYAIENIYALSVMACHSGRRHYFIIIITFHIIITCLRLLSPHAGDATRITLLF